MAYEAEIADKAEAQRKYEQVKKLIESGKTVQESLRTVQMSNGHYYYLQSKDPNPTRKVSRVWSRLPKNKTAKKEAQPKMVEIPLVNHKKAEPQSDDKMVVLICKPTQLKNILEGLE